MKENMERMAAGEDGLGREHYYLDFSAQLDENIDKVNSSTSLFVHGSNSRFQVTP